MTQTAFRLPPDILDALRLVQARDGVGLSEQTRRALREWLTARGALAPIRKQRKK